VIKDANGRTIKQIDIFGDNTEYKYDNLGRVTEVKEEIDGTLKTVKKFSYSESGNQRIATAEYRSRAHDDSWLKKKFYFDIAGRKIEEEKYISVAGGSASYKNVKKLEYDTRGRVVNHFDAMGKKSVYDYDSGDRVISVRKPDGYDITIDYSRGNYFTVTTSGEDGRKSISHADYAGNVWQTQTRISGNDYKKTDYDYKLPGWSKVKEPAYSAGKRLSGEKEVDSLGRMLWTCTPDSGKIEFFYDSLGRLEKRREYGRVPGKECKDIDADDNSAFREISYEYDDLNRITDIYYPGDLDDVAYAYYSVNSTTAKSQCESEFGSGKCTKYAAGNIRSISKGDYYKVSYNYGELWIEEKKIIDNIAYLIRYDYDIQGRIRKITDPDGDIVNYSYNAGGFLERVYSGSKNYISDIDYNIRGQRTSVTYGNGQKTSYTYDADTALLEKMKTLNSDGNTIFSYGYTFDKVGNLKKYTSEAGSAISGTDFPLKIEQNYNYDLAGRLINSDGEYFKTSSGTPEDSYNRNFTFDGSDRMLGKTLKNGDSTPQQNTISHKTGTHAIENIDILPIPYLNSPYNYNYTYDEFGNMEEKRATKYVRGSDPLSRTSKTDVTSFIYDATGRIAGISGDQKALSFKYDNKGQRITKKVSKWEHNPNYDPNDEIPGPIYHLMDIKKTTYVNGFYQITTGFHTSERTDKHISDGTRIIATKFDNNDAQTLYYTTNHIGSTSLLTDKDGNPVQTYAYYPFGENWITNGEKTDVTRLFTGHQYDSETGLYYMNNRYYDPELATFLTADPARDGINHYGYVSGNPINYTDPTGLEWKDINGNKLSSTDLKNKSVYILYNPNFREYAEKQYKAFEGRYSKGSVALSSAMSEKEFQEDWQNMDGEILDISLLHHGSNQAIHLKGAQGIVSTGDGMSNRTDAKPSANHLNVSDLGNPKGNITNATITLGTCNSHNRNQAYRELKTDPSNGYKLTLAESFRYYYNVNMIYANSESIVFNKSTGFPITSSKYFSGLLKMNSSWSYLYRDYKFKE